MPAAAIDMGGTPSRHTAIWRQGFAPAAIVIAVALFRMPRALLHGRFWAEEGTIFAQDLLHADAAGALFYVYKGMVVLLTSVPIWAVLQGPIAWAPLFLTWYALGI